MFRLDNQHQGEFLAGGWWACSPRCPEQESPTLRSRTLNWTWTWKKEIERWKPQHQTGSGRKWREWTRHLFSIPIIPTRECSSREKAPEMSCFGTLGMLWYFPLKVFSLLIVASVIQICITVSYFNTSHRSEMGFPGGSVVKNHLWSRGCRFDPWVRKMPGEKNSNLPQYSCLWNPMDRELWRAIVKESDMIRG